VLREFGGWNALDVDVQINAISEWT